MSLINLLPDDYLQKRAQQRANILCAVMFAIVMAAVGAAAVVSERNTRCTEEVRDQVNASYAEAARMLQQMRELEGQKRTMVQKAQATGSLLERVPRSFLLATITQALPENASLTSLDLTAQMTVSGPSQARSKFNGIAGRSQPQDVVMVAEVVGLAGTDVEVARFIANLLRNPLLNAVDLVFSQEKKFKETTVREFKVKMEIRNNIDVVDLLKPPKGAHAAAPADDGDKGGRT